MKNKERILLKEDEILQEKRIDEAKEVALYINEKVIPQILELGIQPSNEVIIDVLKEARITTELYNEMVEKDISKFDSRAVKSNLRAKANKVLENTKVYFERAKYDIRGQNQYLRYLDIQDGVCILSEEGIESIKEGCRYYLESEDEIRAYKAHKKVVEALNEFFNGRIPMLWQTLFDVKNGEFIINPNANYKYILGNGSN
ncbi:hypothetical protein SAMN05444405_10488 [Bacteroides luti]|uniref:Uncharacterized protein n=1 Tax=Bacteroides luti TaxID=1297750 RepID=A0A1M4XNZ0_9BACE|nr:hypothetical protein [Bacteroides luti]SHE95219.1 hypothetical protein SAMN05444405_10488 [Bacteroides luti]